MPFGLHCLWWSFSFLTYWVPLSLLSWFSLTAFDILIFSLSFNIFAMVCLGLDLIPLSYLELLEFHVMWRLMFFTNFGKLSIIISSNFFFCPFSPLFPITYMLVFLMESCTVLRLCSFFFILSILQTEWSIINVSSSLLILSSINPKVLLSPFSEMFTLVTARFTSRISIF